MRPKVLKWEVIILCVVLFFPGISLNAQEVRQDDIMKSGKAVSRGMDLIRSLCILLIALFIVWGWKSVRNMCFLPIPSCREKTNAGNPFRPLLPLI